MDLLARTTIKSLFVPGSILLLAAIALFWGGLVTVPVGAVDFYYFAAFGMGILLAWRFDSIRICFTLVTLLLAHRALGFFSHEHLAAAGPGRIAFEAVAFLLPLNFLFFAVSPESGLTLASLARRLTLIFFESVFVAVICRPGTVHAPGFLHPAFLGRQPWTHIPQLALITFMLAFALLLTRFLLYRRPMESGFLWSLVAAFFSLQSGGVGTVPTAFMATAGLILLASIIENSYLLAYHDELTALPGRRAFNEAIHRLEAPYTLAAVDIDHFKRVNDTYGHETGDQVLRMVARKLTSVEGGGRAYRVGGEEFTILFPGKSPREVISALETLRTAVEVSTFRVRGREDRRQPGESESQHVRDRRAGKNGDRRAPTRQIRGRKSVTPDNVKSLSVTISIGVAAADSQTREVEKVVRTADKALYRAKKNGRNRIESIPKPQAQRLPRHSVA